MSVALRPGRTSSKDGAQKDWSFAHTKAEFEAVANGSVAFAPGKLLGVAQVNSTLQQGRANPAGDFDPLNTNVPTLEIMTRAALNVLAKNNNGFAVMIEGGAVDWAGHANQSDRNIEEHIDFNNSVKAVVDFVDRGADDIDWTNTLLIVTADHETGNLWGSGSFTDLNGNCRYDAGTDTFNGYQTIDGVGADVLADMQWLSGDHTNALVPLFARALAVSSSPIMSSVTKTSTPITVSKQPAFPTVSSDTSTTPRSTR